MFKAMLCALLVAQTQASANVIVQNRDGVYDRYAEFTVGAYPGIVTTFQLNFGSCEPNVLPINTLHTSTTWKLLTPGNVSSNVSNVVQEYLYYSGQKSLLSGLFVLGDGSVGVLNTCTLNVSFCYSHDFEFRRLHLGQTCPVYATHLYKSVEYAGINASLVNTMAPIELFEVLEGVCSDQIAVSFKDVFSVVVQCEHKVDVEQYAVNIEYHAETEKLVVYHATRERDDTTGGIIIVVLVLFLSVWLYWTRHLHLLIRFSITREQTEGNPVAFEKTLRKALQHETILQSIKATIFRYKDELYPLVGEAFEPETNIDKALAEVAATNRYLVWNYIATFSVVVVDIVVLVGKCVCM